MPTFKMLFPNAKTKALTFSYDDGTKFDRRLVGIFDKYNLKGTFNLNSSRHLGLESTEDVIGEKEVKELYKNHEVAVHTVNHINPDFTSQTTKTAEVFEDRKALEQMVGYIVTGMAYPYGITGGEQMANSMRTCGIDYSRKVRPTRNFYLPSNFYTWEPTCHHNDPELMKLADDFLSDTPSTKLFYCWGHSYEFNKDNNWGIIEEFCEKVANKPQVWYATNKQIFDYVTAYRNLVFSLDNKLVYNGSAISVWLETGGKVYEVPSGKTIEIK